MPERRARIASPRVAARRGREQHEHAAVGRPGEVVNHLRRPRRRAPPRLRADRACRRASPRRHWSCVVERRRKDLLHRHRRSFARQADAGREKARTRRRPRAWRWSAPPSRAGRRAARAAPARGRAARRRVAAPALRAPVRSIQRTSGGRPAAGRSVALRPSTIASSRRTTPRHSLSSCCRRSVISACARRSAIVSISSATVPEPGDRVIELARQPLVPDRVAAEVVVQPQLPGRTGRGMIQAAAGRALRSLVAPDATAGSSRCRSRSRLARLSRSSVRGELVLQRRQQPLARSARAGRAGAAPRGWRPARRGGRRRHPRDDAPRRASAAGTAAAPRPPPSCPTPAAPRGRRRAGGG